MTFYKFFEKYRHVNIRVNINIASRVKLSDRKKLAIDGCDPRACLCAISRPPRNRISDWFRRSFPFRWHSGSSSTGGIQFPVATWPGPRQIGSVIARVSLQHERRNQMYRNDLCTWLDILSPRHTWPPIATSLPVTRNERRTQPGENTIADISSPAKSPLWIRASFFASVVNILSRISRDNAFTHRYSRRTLNLSTGNPWNCARN